ncbi:MAG: hypothetical protein IT229_00205 [Flavobacteriales bacterium]|nr:hypothetical protein [Flavobacteriales bacterium]
MRAFSSLSLIVALALNGPSGQAQTPTHQSVVHNTTGATISVVNGVAADADGNMIITGWRSDALDFGGTAHPQGTGAIFLAKFDAQGTELWSKVSGSADLNGNHKGMSVAVDGNGNVYNCGWVFAVEMATFDGTTLPVGSAGYVAKYSASGTLLWVKDFAGGVNAIAVDGNGNPFINYGDATIEKLDPANGNSVASATGGGDLQNVGYHNLAVDASNNVIAQWGNKITKYDNALNTLWSTPLVKPTFCESFRISLDGSGNVWATFYALFGTVTLGGTDYTTFPNGYIYNLDGSTGAVLSCASPGAYKIKKVIGGDAGTLYAFGDFAFNDPYLVKYDASLTALSSVLTFDTKDVTAIGPDCFVLGGAHDANITLDGTTYDRPNGSPQDNAIAGYLCAGTVGVEERTTNEDLLLFPNPAKDDITVRGDFAQGSMQVLAVDGSIERAITYTRPSTTVDVSGLANGIYLLRDREGRSQRFVVAR